MSMGLGKGAEPFYTCLEWGFQKVLETAMRLLLARGGEAGWASNPAADEELKLKARRMQIAYTYCCVHSLYFLYLLAAAIAAALIRQTLNMHN